MPMPTISVVTPSYNQGAFLEEAIQSVVSQNYPNLVYIIMDGGSTDNSVEIIRKYEPWLTYWVSERDKGQADAIYRGFQKASGDILGWLNSDDLLLPGSLLKVGKYFSRHHQKACVVGGTIFIDEKSRVILDPNGLPQCNLGYPVSLKRLIFHGCGFNQPSTFWKRKEFFQVGGFDRKMNFCFDYDMYIRLSRLAPFGRIRDFLSAFRIHGASKTATMVEVMNAENEALWRKYGRYRVPSLYRKLMSCYFRKKDRLDNRILRFGLCHGLVKFPCESITMTPDVTKEP